MLDSSPIMIAIAVWVIVTVIYLLLVGAQAFLGMREENTLFLSAGESSLEAGQRDLQKKVKRLAPYLRVSGWASIGLLVVIAGMWGYGVLKDLLR
jgi:hypothetical protein